MLKSSSYWLTVSLSKYADSSEAAARDAPEVVACNKALVDVLLDKVEEAKYLKQGQHQKNQNLNQICYPIESFSYQYGQAM